MTGCWHKDCENCRNGVFLKHTFFGDNVYYCKVTGAKVKDTRNRGDCGSWMCGCEKDQKKCPTCSYR